MATQVWTGSVSTDPTVAGNWVSGVAPVTGDTVEFGNGVGALQNPVTWAADSIVYGAIDFTGYTSTATISGHALNCSGSVTFGTGMTLTSNSSSSLVLSGTGTLTAPALAGGTTAPATTINGSGITVTLGSAFTCGSNTLTLTQGTFDTSGSSFTVTAGKWSSSNSNTRTVTLHNSSLTFSIAGPTQAWDMTTGTNATITANTATITLSGASNDFRAGGLNYGNLSLIYTGGGVATFTPSGTPSLKNLTVTGTAVKTDALTISGNFTLTGTFTLSGNSATNRLLVQSNVLGTQRTITNTGATMTWSNVDFQDIKLSTAFDASAITGNSGDCQGNSGITFTTAAPQTWNGNTTGNWSNSANWTSRVPLPQDNVAINGLTSGTVTADMPRIGANIDLTSSSGGTFTLGNAVTSYGNVTLNSTVARTGAVIWTLSGRGAQAITSNTISLPTVAISAPSGTYTLQDAFTSLSQLSIVAGTFTANNQSLTMQQFASSGTNTRTVNMGTAGWTINTAGATAWTTATTTNLTLNVSTAVVSFTNTSGTATITTGGVTMPSITVNGAGGTTALGDAFTTAGTVTLTSGTLSTSASNFNITCGIFSSSNSTVRTLTLGTATMTLTASSGTAWSTVTTTNLTITASAHTILITGTGSVTWSGTPTVNAITYAPTTANLTNVLSLGSALNVTNAFSAGDTGLVGGLTGTYKAPNRLLVASSVQGTARTITAGSVTTSTVGNVDFRDITGSGWTTLAASNTIGDLGGNSSITFPAGANQFWFKDTANFSTAGNWFLATNGGGGAGRVPLPQDTAKFDANSFSAGSKTVTFDTNRSGAVDWTGATNTPTAGFTVSGAQGIIGAWTGISGMAYTGTAGTLSMRAQSSVNFTAGASLSAVPVQINAFSGTVTLQDSPTSTGNLTLVRGTLTIGAHTWTTSSFTATSNTAAVLDLSNASAVLAATGTSGTIWNTNSASLSITAGGVVQFTGTSGTPTITTGGVVLPNVTFNGAGGTWVQGDALSVGTNTIQLSAGTWDTSASNYSVTAGIIFISNAGTSTVTWHNSTLTCSASSQAAVNAQTVNLTVTANTATVVLSGATAQFGTGSKNWNGLSVNFTGSGAAAFTGTGPATFANVTRTGTALKTDSLSLAWNPTVTGTLTLTGNTVQGANRLLISSSVVGTQRVITMTGATVAITGDVSFMDISVDGGTAPTWTNASSCFVENCGGNSTTITSNATQADTFNFTNTSGGTWSTPGNWSAGSVHSSAARSPLAQDTVTLNTAFTTSRTVTADMPRLGGSIDWTGATFTTALTWALTTTTSIFGSVKLIGTAGFATSNSVNVTLAGRGNYALTSNGTAWTTSLTVSAPNGTYTLVDALRISDNVRQLVVTNGTFADAGNSVTVGIFNSANSGTCTVTASGAWTLNGTGTIYTISSTGRTLNLTGNTVTIGDASSATKTIFVSTGVTLGTFIYTNAGTGTLAVTTSSNSGTVTLGLNISGAVRTVTFTHGVTYALLDNTSVINGVSAGSHAIVQSDSPGNSWFLTVPDGEVAWAFVTLSDSHAS